MLTERGLDSREEKAGRCEYCHDSHSTEELVPVVAGEIVDFGSRGSGIDVTVSGSYRSGSDPAVDFWCPHRVESEFDVQADSRVRNRLEENRSWFNVRNWLGFVVGVILTSLLFVLFTGAV